jgi:hypothetical protein
LYSLSDGLVGGVWGLGAGERFEELGWDTHFLVPGFYAAKMPRRRRRGVTIITVAYLFPSVTEQE